MVSDDFILNGNNFLSKIRKTIYDNLNDDGRYQTIILDLGLEL